MATNHGSDHIELTGLERPERHSRRYSSNPFEYENPPDITRNINNEVVDQDIFDRPKMITSIHRHASYGASNAGLKHSYMARTGGYYRVPKTNYLENHAVEIVSKMEQDPQLMEDSPSSELLRREALRDMPQCLTIKRRIKEKLRKSVSQKSKRKPIGCCKYLKYHISMRFTKLKTSLRDLSYSLELWYNSLKQIEGHFGSGVASYFRFLRWLFILNIFVAIFPLSFIVIPQAVYASLDSSTHNNTTVQTGAKESFSVQDLISAEGYLTNTVLYYGFYDATITIGGVTYSMAYAYFLTMIVVYLICLIISSISAARSYRKNFIQTEGGLKNLFAQKIFCGWDYSIATKQAAYLKSASLYQELKEFVSELDTKSSKRPWLLVFWTKTIQIVSHILILISIAGVSYLIWYLKNTKSNHVSTVELAIAVNVIMLILPPFFNLIVRYEDYKNPRITLGVSLFRCYLLGAAILGVLVEFWLTHTNSLEVECRKKTNSWETCLAQEMFRLIMFDFIFSVIIAGCFHLLVYLYCRLFRKNRHVEFDIASNTLQIIFNQTLLWVGLMFSPLLVILVVIKLFIIWYIKHFTAMKLCKPSAKTWRAAQTETWFLILTFLSCLIIICIYGYVFLKIAPSQHVGPFLGLEYVYQLVIDLEIYGLKAYSNFYQPAVVSFILIALGIRIYYLRAKCHAQKGLVEILREMLVWESKDKEFLLQHISRSTKDQWKYRYQSSQLSDPYTNPPEIFNRRSKFSFRDISEESSGISLSQLIDTPGPSKSGISLQSTNSNDPHASTDWSYKKFT